MFLTDGGSMGELIRRHDWSQTEFGPLENWPHSLRSAANICLSSLFPTAIYWGRSLRLLYNDAWSAIPGRRHPWALGRPAEEVWNDIWHVIGPQMRGVMETGRGFATYDEMLPMERGGRAGTQIFWNYSFTPIQGDDGHVEGILNSGHETTERVRTERRLEFLLELGDKLRPLDEPSLVIEAAAEALGRHLGTTRVGYGDADESGDYVTLEQNWTDGTVPAKTGRYRLTDFGRDLLDTLRSGRTAVVNDISSDRHVKGWRIDAFETVKVAAMITVPLVKKGRLVALLYVVQNTPREWTDLEILISEETGERIWEAVERARAQQLQRLLTHELNHRVKNTLATVQGIAMQTLRQAQTLEDAREALVARLGALAKAHDVLTRESFEGAMLADLVEAAMSVHAAGPDRVTASGPAVRLAPRTALPIAMALHELATNAVKYGALSNDTGRIAITWWNPAEPRGERLHLQWAESGGPEVTLPTRRGFGVRMIEQGLAAELGGDVRIEFRPEGVVCTIDAPLPPEQDQRNQQDQLPIGARPLMRAPSSSSS
jgi:two-component sensor histidine kinase